MATPRPRVLDGRTLEGGGQLLRVATSLSALTRTPLRITHIRGNRPGGGGLKSQHLACVKWLAEACSAAVEGAEKGSRELLFLPAQGTEGVNPPVYRKSKEAGGSDVWRADFDVKTAGSTGLGLQAILPFLLFSPPREDDGKISPLPLLLTLRGGTNVSVSPSYEYISRVLLPTLVSLGLPTITPTLQKRGWSHGGTCIGSFTLFIPARTELALPPVNLWPADTTLEPMLPTKIEALFIGPAAAHATLRACLASTISELFGQGGVDVLDLTCEDSGHAKRYYLLLVATVPASSSDATDSREYILARDDLYASKIRDPATPAVEMAERVTQDLYDEWKSGAWVDEFMRDQLVVFRALGKNWGRIWGGRADGGVGEGERTEREASLHAKTAEWVVEQMLGNRREEAKEDGAEALDEGVSKLELG